MTIPTISDNEMFAGFDQVAGRLGVTPPRNPGEQVVTALMMKWFVLGVRWHQHVTEHLEAAASPFAMPGIDFDPSAILDEMGSFRR